MDCILETSLHSVEVGRYTEEGEEEESNNDSNNMELNTVPKRQHDGK